MKTMTTTKIFRILGCFFLLLAVLHLPALAEEAKEENKTETAEPSETAVPTVPVQASLLQGLAPSHFFGGFVSIGGGFNNRDGSIDKIFEYQAFRQGTRPTGEFGIWGNTDGLSYDLSGRRGLDPTDQDYDLRFNMRRFWKSEVTYTRMPHRLTNDPLTNLDTGKGPVIVLHTSEDEGVNYCPVYKDVEWNNLIKLGSNLSATFDYRTIGRSGSNQARTMSKCANCHVVSKVREIDQDTEEWKAGLHFTSNLATLSYEYSMREFVENAWSPLNVFDEVRHPKFLSRVFTDRAQYEKSDGPLPFGALPKMKKRMHKLRAQLYLPADAGQLTGAFIDSANVNIPMAYGIDTQVASGRYSLLVGDRFGFTMQARNLNIDSDTFYVDVNERVADGGPNKGNTYSESYPDIGELDYWARSALERQQFDFTLEGRVTMPAKSVFRFGYEFDDLKRPNFEVERTKSHTFKAAFNTSPLKALRGRARYSYRRTSDPFTHVHAALPPALQPYPSPPAGSPSPFPGTQYFEIYRAREIDLTNYPTDSHEFTGSLNWRPRDRFALNAHLRAKKHSNDALNSVGGWNEKAFTPSVDLWFAPSEKVDILASYSLHQRKTESVFGIAVYDG
jgi:hypothetical protein